MFITVLLLLAFILMIAEPLSILWSSLNSSLLFAFSSTCLSLLSPLWFGGHALYIFLFFLFSCSSSFFFFFSRSLLSVSHLCPHPLLFQAHQSSAITFFLFFFCPTLNSLYYPPPHPAFFPADSFLGVTTVSRKTVPRSKRERLWSLLTFQNDREKKLNTHHWNKGRK